MDSSLIAIGFFIVLIFLTIWFLIVKFIANYQLNKLRRKYDAEEDVSRRKELGGFRTQSGADKQYDSSEQYTEGDDEYERRSLLQDSSDLNSREDKPRVREFKREQKGSIRSIRDDKQRPSKTNEALRKRFGLK